MARAKAGIRKGRRRGASLALLGAALGLSVAAPAAGAEECVRWPGEPTPRLGNDDPLYQRWLALRKRQLTRDARAAEGEDPVRAHLLWRRLGCLAADDPEVADGIARTSLVRVYRPAVLARGAWVRPVHFRGDDPWLDLAVAIPVGEPPRELAPEERAAARKRLLEGVDRRLDQGEEHLRQARFEEALVAGRDVRARLEAMRRADDLDAPGVRLEVLFATAQLALGDDAGARASLSRALTISPTVTLDPTRTPPKLRRAFEAVRAAQPVEP